MVQKGPSRRHLPNAVLPTAKLAYDLIALTASLGGLKALTQVLSALPSNFPAAVIALQHLAKVNFVRPSADVLFKSVAASFKSQAIAVVITGRGRDDTLGVQTIKKHGDTVFAQGQLV